MKKCLLVVSIIFIILSLVITVNAENIIEEVKAKVVEVNETEEIAKENEKTKKIQKVTVRILEGEYENEEYEMEYIITDDIESITSNLELQEDENILVSLEEKEGEVTTVSYIETINSSYILYIIGTVLILLLLIIRRKRATLVYLLTIILTGGIVIFSLQNGWNLILVCSILSLLITIILFISINGLKKETILMIVKAILGIAISGILIYILFDIMNLVSMNIKITEKLVNIKDLICSATILFSCGIYNAIAISGQYIFYAANKPYKTKSENIIEGQ